MLDGIEFGAQGTIDHAAAELDDQSADNGGLDFDIETDVLAADGIARRTQRLRVFVPELLPATSASKRSSSLFTASIAFASRARSNSAVA